MKKLLVIPVVVIGLIGATLFTEIVPTGHVGVVYDKLQKGVQDEVLSEGIHLVSPFQKIENFTVAIETVYMSKDEREGSDEDESINIVCKDGSLNADLTFNYRFNAEDTPKVLRKYRGKNGKEIMNTVLRGQLRTWISEVTKNYSTIEVHMDKREEINTNLTKYLNEKGEKYGVVFENVSIAETRVSANIQSAIEKRQQIAQELEQQKLNLEKAEIAKKEEQLKQEQALIRAKGERQANEERAKGLSQNVLKEMAIEKWDGKLPQSTGGASILDLR